MLIPCEIAVKCVLPSIRAEIAKELTTKHGLKQVEAAKLLGVSQSAISLYQKRIRGRSLDLEEDEEVMALIGKMAETLLRGEGDLKDFIVMFCDICRIIRSKGMMCKLHKRMDPSIDIEECDLCTLISPRCMVNVNLDTGVRGDRTS